MLHKSLNSGLRRGLAVAVLTLVLAAGLTACGGPAVSADPIKA